MATPTATTATIPTTPTKTIISATVPAIMPLKKAGPPVPPRPSHASAHAAGLLKTQRNGDSVMNAVAQQNRVAATTGTAATSFASSSSVLSSRVSIGNVTASAEMQHNSQHPIIQKKPSLSSVSGGAGGRTIIYKSPSMSAPKRPEAPPPTAGAPLGASTGSTTTRSGTNIGPKPPLKLRKAPDIPTMKPKATAVQNDAITGALDKECSVTKVPVNSVALGKSPPPAPASSVSPTEVSNANSNIVIVQTAASAVNLSRHHSMGSGSPKSQSQTNSIKDTRLSLGRVDFERVGKIQLDQLPTSVQPLPRPRKIVKVPVATMDLDDTASTNGAQSHSSSVSIFRRSKTTLDNFTSRANITTINTGGVANTFLGGKTAELKNNLKNAAERLFSEIIVNQQRHGNESPIITKHEPAMQHPMLLTQALAAQRNVAGVGASVTVVTTGETTNNCTRININTSDSAHSSGGKIENILKSPEKKAAFHEILISELAAMRGRSCSMENLTRAETPKVNKKERTPLTSPVSEPITKITTTSIIATTAVEAAKNPLPSNSSTAKTYKTHSRKRCNSIEDQDPDTEDVDADNVEDTEDGDEDDLQKNNRNNKFNGVGTPRKRCPSGCSSDSSPYGTERSARIRTSDWIEVGDNGKEVTMTSCHISLEDSGLEDEERLDEMSSLGVGDSWDSVKEAENMKRCRSVK
ncbi:PREDICTED: probable serine/threonine-protein kinase nek3, partial [Rhagoletis zephyria]|uniref:probable serine/threonine-protein kinase nek3 n=1 Tax=Rhagoletis zephyria TaxID=28612 RepID=UPI0008113568